MINPEKIRLPVWVIGVGLIHAVALALVLPMLITLPGPGSIEHKAEAVDVELVPAIPSAPKIDDVDQTAALPASPQPEPEVGEVASEPVDEPSADAPAAVANVDPESVPSAAPVEQAEPASETPVPAIAAPKKSKVEGKAKRAKAARPAPKKPAVVRATTKPKPVYRRTSQDVAKKGLIPFKGSWSQLLGGPTPVPAKR